MYKIDDSTIIDQTLIITYAFSNVFSLLTKGLITNSKYNDKIIY